MMWLCKTEKYELIHRILYSAYGQIIHLIYLFLGVHCKAYYSLEVSYFKSELDKHILNSLWNKYWVNTLSSSNLITVSA